MPHETEARTTLPAELLDALARLEVDVSTLRRLPASTTGRASTVRVASDEAIVDIALDPDGRRWIALEAGGRRWASAAGVSTPTVLGVDEQCGWLISGAVPSDHPSGRKYVQTALEAALRISRGPPRADGPAPSTWRAPARTLPLRWARAVRWRMPIRDFLRARRAAARLPGSSPIHGDFHDENVLWDHAEERVHVVDWEHASTGPEYSDALRLATTLVDEGDRTLALELILGEFPPARRLELGALAYWLSLRHLADHATAVSGARDAERISLLASRARETKEWARDLGAWPPRDLR